MLQDAADVPTGGLRQVGVGPFSEEQRLSTLPKTLVYMHASAVVIKDRLRHEGCCFAVLFGNVANNVFVGHHVIGSLNELLEHHSQFVLTGASNFMVVLLSSNPQLSHH